jgi:negative regulator of flagellin synthesis FlgM
MTERINGQGFRPTDTAGTRRTDSAKSADKSAPAETSATGTHKASGDTVNLTRSAVLLSKLEELVHSLPVVDADRVRAIKEELASGSYAIDEQAVADKMIRFDRELLA